MILLVVAGCGPPASQRPEVEPNPTSGPARVEERATTQPAGQEAVVVQSEAQVRRENSEVQAGPGDVVPLPLLTDNQFRPLESQGVVTTNDNGEAQVRIRDCLTIFVFQRSQLVTAACPRSNAVSGSPTCAFGTSAFNNQCAGKVSIQTRSSEIELQGTWLTVTYVPETRMSLTMVYEGQIKVWPVRDYETRTLGDPLIVGERHFWFSDPGDTAASVAGLAGRRVYPFEMAPAVMSELNMTAWLHRIRPRAEAAGIDFPEYLIPSRNQAPTPTYQSLPSVTPRPRPTGTATATPTSRATSTPNVTPTQTARVPAIPVRTAPALDPQRLTRATATPTPPWIR